MSLFLFLSTRPIYWALKLCNYVCITISTYLTVLPCGQFLNMNFISLIQVSLCHYKIGLSRKTYVICVKKIRPLCKITFFLVKKLRHFVWKHYVFFVKKLRPFVNTLRHFVNTLRHFAGNWISCGRGWNQKLKQIFVQFVSNEKRDGKRN